MSINLLMVTHSMEQRLFRLNVHKTEIVTLLYRPKTLFLMRFVLALAIHVELRLLKLRLLFG